MSHTNPLQAKCVTCRFLREPHAGRTTSLKGHYKSCEYDIGPLPAIYNDFNSLHAREFDRLVSVMDLGEIGPRRLRECQVYEPLEGTAVGSPQTEAKPAPVASADVARMLDPFRKPSALVMG